MKKSFDEAVLNVQTEEDINTLITEVDANVKTFKAAMAANIEETLDVGRNNERIADDMAGAEAEADDIRTKVEQAFDDAYGDIELTTTAKRTSI
jgi:hypothetical protein